MTIDATFFKRGETSFGVFYPLGYVLSVFPSAADLDQVAKALCAAGFPVDDVGVARADEARDLLRMLPKHLGAFVRYERWLSSHRGDETELEGELNELAETGHGFVFTYAPHAAATDLAANTVRPFGPVVLLKYDRFLITEPNGATTIGGIEGQTRLNW
jgi:hypothetical protein